jgi:sterol 3beta-glucosyltransferase
MVASAGAGPPPIHHTKLTIDNLAAAIAQCLSPECIASARRIQNSMAAEDGVKTAADSFHRWLPTQALQCDLLPNETAVWRLRKSKKPTKLSAKAVAVLANKELLEPKDLAL